MLNHLNTYLATALETNRALTMKGSDIEANNSANTASFEYNPAGTPLLSTQQLNVDWSQFENHSFFSPAVVNVNSAFDRIINGYPFDGTRVQVEQFMENLTGFEKWVLDEWPKYRGQLHFSGGLQNYISVADAPGALYPELASDESDGMASIAPVAGESMTIEMHLYPPELANDNQIVVQKTVQGTEGLVGFSLYLSSSVSTSTAEMFFLVSSGSHALLTSGTVTKGEFNHIVAEYDCRSDQSLKLVVGPSSSYSNSKHTYMGSLETPATPLLVGSGTSMACSAVSFTPQMTMSGVMDELRIFKSIRSQTDIDAYTEKSIYARSDLTLYFKFNEPPPPLVADSSGGVNSIVLDSSGHDLHANVSNFVSALRVNSSGSAYGDPMTYEREALCPILFPGYTDVADFNEELLSSASLYDSENPNVITRLVPRHYFLEGQVQEGLEAEDGTITDAYTSTGIPGSGQLGQSQLLMSLLYAYARYFDELKLFVDAFVNTQYVAYDKDDTVPDTFLQRLLVQNGFVVPPVFTNSTIEQYVDAENIEYPVSSGEHSLRYVQNELLRRVLVNLPSIIRSKGTQHGIKVLLRSLGIDPENSCRIREYGGPTKLILGSSRENKKMVGPMLEFGPTSLVRSPILSASRTETGFPDPAGGMVLKDMYPPHGISNNLNDGLLTSGSWTIEAVVSFPSYMTASTSGYNSLMRLCTSGTTAAPNMLDGLVANLVAASGSSTLSASLTLYARPGREATAPLLSLRMDDVDIYTGDMWSVSFGRDRNDDIDSVVSSSYFLRAGRSMNGNIVEYYSTSSFLLESPAGTCVLGEKDASVNATGTYIAVGGGQTFNAGAGAYYLLNNTLAVSGIAREIRFSGLLSNVRFWSRGLTETEWKEHVRNPYSLGTVDPLTEFNYIHTPTGSFGRLRVDSVIRQDVTASNAAGEIVLIDYTGNEFHLTGSGFTASTDVLVPKVFDVGFISPTFDEPATDDKVRIRSFLEQSNIDEHIGASLAPLYSLEPSERPNDDVRLSVEFSLIDALNRDMVLIFSTFEALDNALGDPALMFSPDYPDIERMRDMYFNRLSEKLNFKAFHEFFKFFDVSLGTFIEQLIPKKTKFKGVNFVIESHMLERSKLEYHFQDMYLGEDERQDVSHTLLLQQIVGSARKF